MSAPAPKVLHLLYDVYMGWGHSTLIQILQANTGKGNLGRGELAVFMNRKWTACKILGPNNTMLYWRSPNGASISIDQLKSLPTNFGGSRFTLAGNLENNALKRLQLILEGTALETA